MTDDQNPKRSLHHHRREYEHPILLLEDTHPDPLEQFHDWLELVLENNDAPDATAMTLSTAGQGRVSSRIVLLKSYSARDGFVFFGSHGSRKGLQLQDNPQASLLFYWSAFSRQVRIEGRVERISREEELEYFRSRPRESQLAATASSQSRPVADRADLDDRYVEMERQFSGRQVDCPEEWGGWALIPDYFEFWQGRPSRLHDRIIYQPALEGHGWVRSRLAP
jgi:pyridoxamine 5'-phosphate oxidase